MTDTENERDHEMNTEPLTELSPREREVAGMLAVGATNHEIADKLDISIKTVDTHRGHVLKKLKLRNNVELALLAVRRGCIRFLPDEAVN